MAAPPDKPLDPRQEAFCHAYVYYANAAEAAFVAGYAAGSRRQQGYRLLRTPAVAQRIAAIRRRMAEDGCRETGVLLGKLENVYNRAVEHRQYVAAARTVEIQARLAGLMPSVHERLRALAPPAAAPSGGGDAPDDDK